MSVPHSNAERDLETQRLSVSSLSKSVIKIRSEEVDRAMWVAVWMVLSSAVVIYNKWLFSAGGFPYPLALTSMHMTCCFVVFGSIRNFAPANIRLAIMPDADVETPWPIYIKNFLAISVFYAGTLGTGNLAYLYSSVAFVQMMKPMNCIFASFAAFAVGVDLATNSHLIIVSVIAFGIFFATHNASAAQFSTTGCVLQIISSCSEGCRLAMVQLVTTSGLKLDPVTTVYHFSFGSAVLLICACYLMEWHTMDLSKLISPWALVANCAMALVLNVLVAHVIKKTSAVTFALSGIVKDIGIIVASSLLFMTPITRLMFVGYTISLSGLCMFKAYKDNLTVFKELGFVGGMRFTMNSMTGRPATVMI